MPGTVARRSALVAMANAGDRSPAGAVDHHLAAGEIEPDALAAHRFVGCLAEAALDDA